MADILPTLVRAAGGTVPEETDGLDLIALARGGAEVTRKYIESTCSVVNGSNENPDYLALTDGKWKYIWYPEGSAEQLFNLVEDPNELRNLASLTQYKENKEALYRELVLRHTYRNSPLVRQGKLVDYPVRGDSAADRRNHSWPGFHTDRYEVDVRH